MIEGRPHSCSPPQLISATCILGLSESVYRSYMSFAHLCNISAPSRLCDTVSAHSSWPTKFRTCRGIGYPVPAAPRIIQAVQSSHFAPRVLFHPFFMKHVFIFMNQTEKMTPKNKFTDHVDSPVAMAAQPLELIMDCKETGVTGPVGNGLAGTKGSVGTVIGALDTVETWRPQAPGAVGKAEAGAIGRGWPFMTYCIGLQTGTSAPLRDNDEPFEQEKIVKAEVKTGADIGDERSTIPTKYPPILKLKMAPAPVIEASIPPRSPMFFSECLLTKQHLSMAE